MTSDSIKVGIVWYDLSSLVSVLHINDGDFLKAYQAMVDNINAKGGIHGRKLDATMVGINPTSQSAADQACTKLTQDEKVFVAVGFFLADNVLCYVNTNATATIGGAQTAARLAQAKAPWFSTDAGENLEINVVKTLAKQGKLNGKLAVMAAAADQDLLNDKIKPALTAAGIKPVSTAILDAPTNDTTATYAQAETISEKFKSDGATQVLVVGESGPGSYLPGLAKTDYRPQIVVSDLFGMNAYTRQQGQRLHRAEGRHLRRDVRAHRRPAGPGRSDQGVHGHPAQGRPGHQAVLDGASPATPTSSWPRSWPAPR